MQSERCSVVASWSIFIYDFSSNRLLDKFLKGTNLSKNLDYQTNQKIKKTFSANIQNLNQISGRGLALYF